MSTATLVNPDAKEGMRMSGQAGRLSGRLLAWGAALLLALVLAGDRGAAYSVPVPLAGQDPLDVLQLKVRPNVIVVLDTSGSMKWNLQAPALPGQDDCSKNLVNNWAGPACNFAPPDGGDHPRSKVWQAKQVLKQIVQGNQDKASFLFAQYTQDLPNSGASPANPSIVMANRAATLMIVPDRANNELKRPWSGKNYDTSFPYPSRNRFQYSTYSCAGGACPAAVTTTMTNGTANNGLVESSTMASTEIRILKDRNATASRGLQSWQLIYPPRTKPTRAGWNTLYYTEIGSKTYTCAATLPLGPGPEGEKFYAIGGKSTVGGVDIVGSLAADLRTAMNNPSGCSRGVSRNFYDVTYDSATGIFKFSRTSGSNDWAPLWVDNANRPNNIRGALNANTSTSSSDWAWGSPKPKTSDPTPGSGSFSSGTPYTLLYRPVAAAYAADDAPNEGFWYNGMSYKFTETIPPGGTGTTVTVYNASAQRFWNGEVLKVNDAGEICDLTFANTPTSLRTNPPSFTVQRVGAFCGGAVAGTAVFRWGGAFYTGSFEHACDGFSPRVSLVPCDLRAPAPTQFSTITPWLNNEFPLDATGMPEAAPKDMTPGAAATATTVGYVEAQDGTWGVATVANVPQYPPYFAGGIKGLGATPISNSLKDVKTLFGVDDTTGLWGKGQAGATVMAGPPPYNLSAIKTHTNPKEKTIVLFVTDGEDTCSGQPDQDQNALAAAYQAERLYTRIVATEAASSVQTFVIGFGGAFGGTEAPRLNWIAWGGSGLGSPSVSNNGTRWTPGLSGTYNNDCSVAGSQCDNVNKTLKPLRDDCPTCQDAFLAPDAQTLATKIQGIIDQGAQDGEFTATQSVTENVFEYVDLARTSTKDVDPRMPAARYAGLAPTKITSSFSLPGYNGQVKAYQNVGDAAVLRWSAGDKLWKLVQGGVNGQGGMTACDTTTDGGGKGLCTFDMLHGGATDATIAGSAAAIKRRVYTTSRNGVYINPETASKDLMDPTYRPPAQLTLWPPDTNIAPASFATEGSLDKALGLPTDADIAANASKVFSDFQTQFQACTGSNLPPAGTAGSCSSNTVAEKAKAARREAREMILAFMMGAEPVPTTGGVSRGKSGPALYRLLFKVRSWVLADSELATVAVVTPPLPYLPKLHTAEYDLMVKGPRQGGKNPDSAGDELRQGFGLRTPDDDDTASKPNDNGTIDSAEIDSRVNLKPVMSVVFAPANDMLHAFRAGPNQSPSSVCNDIANPTTDECGGQELWGFVPYDMLYTARLRYINQPQTRDNHVYMLARAVRFSDVWVPGSMTNALVGGVPQSSMGGVWRRVMWFGRGIGGKYVTALDVTAIGPYTTTALNTRPPVPLWSRGNPDTDGTAANADNGSAADKAAYAKMGETWSVPVSGMVDTNNPIYSSSRWEGGKVEFAIFMGSGYGAPGEGMTFFTLDALTGDVLAAADVEAAAAAYGLTRTGASYPGFPASLVPNAAGFQPEVFQTGTASGNVAVHPASAPLRRLYIGDTHGRIWKFLTASPDVAIPFADVGAGQPIGTAVALNGLPPWDAAQGDEKVLPYVHATSGNDRRVTTGPFRIFGFRDNGTSTSTATSGTSTDAGVTVFRPAELLQDPATSQFFAQDFAPGTPEGNCGYLIEALFRGTVQPATTYEEMADGSIVGRVFYGGTRLSPPNTKFAPLTPLACGCTPPTCSYPCRSQFDSILYALGSATGTAAYDLNASGSDAYRMFRDSRLVAISLQADPRVPGYGSLNLDEGIVKGNTPKPPPPPGSPPGVTGGGANVYLKREPGQPPPAVRYGTTVCE